MKFRLFIFPICIIVLSSIFDWGEAVGKTEKSADIKLAKPSRADLVIPDDIWKRALAAVGFENKVYGFSADEMANFRGSTNKLALVEALFRDVTALPRFTGRVGDLLLAAPDDIGNAALIAFGFLEATGGRGITPPTDPGNWGFEWIPAGVSPDEAVNLIIDKGIKQNKLKPVDQKNINEWLKLPECVKRLVVRILLASMESAPIIREAFDDNFYKDFFLVKNLDEINRDDLYKFAVAPWSNESTGVTPRESFDAISRLDKYYLGSGSVKILTYARSAVAEFQASTATEELRAAYTLSIAGFEKCVFDTMAGRIGIFGAGNDKISGDYSLIVDLGGDDVYSGKIAVPKSFSQPVSIVIDIGGNDKYDSGDERGGLACGNHGVGAIFDLNGYDTYTCKESGIGCGLYGSGVVVDYSGDDIYTTKFQWGQGAAHAGIGLLIDLDGNDKYNTVQQSQGFGSTLGTGILVDVSGNDVYYGDPEGNTDPVFEGRTVSFVQGAGFGRRADFGDGHSMGGGVGFLVDGGGNDRYTGSVYSQGAGYWWAVGALEDRAGDDVYYNEQYSAGSAPHFALGCCVDLEGDDMYNIGNNDLARQVMACARDGSVAVFIDGSGNDQYFYRNLCAGSSDLNCLTLFWDRTGSDSYIADRNPPQEFPWSFGDAIVYTPFNTFRDFMPSCGIFLDTGGSDTYREIMPSDPEQAKSCKPLPFGDNKEWRQRQSAPFWGFGLDIDWFAGLEKTKD